MTTWQITESMTKQTVPALYRQYRRAFRDLSALHIACAKAAHIDSAGVAWLLDCVREAKQYNVALTLSGLPNKTIALIKAQGVWPLLSGVIKE